MPTTRPRHVLTETDALEIALKVAAQEWPEDAARPSRLLLHLIEEGKHAITGERERKRARNRKRHLAAVERHRGQFTGLYPKDYLKRLREEWPD